MNAQETSPFANPLTVAFFGISGSGKGTQADLLERLLTDKDPDRGVERAEMGALIREFYKSETALAKRAREIVDGGGLLPSFMPVYLLTNHLNQTFKGVEHLILDGVCRRPLQSELIDEIVRFYGRNDPQGIVMELSPMVAKTRLSGRGRIDDATDEAMQKRFAWYTEHVVPSIEVLEKKGWKMHRINGEPDIQTIQKDIITKLGLPV